MGIYPAGAAAGYCFLLVSSSFCFFILPAQPQDTVFYSFPLLLLYPAGAAAGSCFLLVSSFFLSLPCRFRRQGIVFFVFLSSSGNTSTANNFNISWLIFTKLGHNNPYLRGIMSHDQQGVKGHVGVKGHFSLKMLLLLQILSHGHVTYTYEASTCPVLYLCFFSRSEV